MKSRDTKRTSQHTFDTNHPTVSFHLDSHSQQRIPCGQKVASFGKVKIDGILKSKLIDKKLTLSKQNNPRQEFNVNISSRTNYEFKEIELSRKNSMNISTHRPSSKAKSFKSKDQPIQKILNSQIIEIKKKGGKFKKDIGKQKAKDTSFLMKTGRQLIMSTVDSKTLRALKNQKSYDKLRSITQEQSQVYMKAKRLSLKKKAVKQLKSKFKIKSPPSKIQFQSYVSTNTLQSDKSFSLFKESINEIIDEQELNESIESLYLDYEDDQLLSIEELRKFQGNKLRVRSSQYFKNFNKNNGSLSIRDRSALKIQNCWRSYKTRQMVIKHLNEEVYRSMITEEYQADKEFNLDFMGRRNGIILERIDMNVLNCSDQLSLSYKKEQFQKLRQEQGRKWAQIPQMVEAYLSKNNSQADTRSLLQKIATLSQRNKEDLLKISHVQIHSPKTSRKSSVNSPEKSFEHSFDNSIDQLSQYNFQKYKKLIEKDNMNKLMKCRKQLLMQRYKAQRQMIQSKRENGEITQSEYKKQVQHFQEWMMEETDDIETTKRYLQIGYSRVKESINKINTDFIKMSKLKGESLKNNFYSSDSLIKYSKIVKNTQPVSQNNSKQIIRSDQFQNYSDSESQNSSLLISQTQNQKQTDNLKKRLDSLELQYSERSLVSNSSSHKILKRSYNPPLHQQSHTSPQSDSSDDSIDIQQLASISHQIQIKNLITKFNKDQVKQSLSQQIFKSLIQQVIKQSSHLNVDLQESFIKYLQNNIQQAEQEGIQTDIQTIKYFCQIIQEYLEDTDMVEYMQNLSRDSVSYDEQYFQIIFNLLWFKIKQQLQFNNESEVAQKENLQEIAMFYYKSIYTSLNQILINEINLKYTRNNNNNTNTNHNYNHNKLINRLTLKPSQCQHILLTGFQKLKQISNFKCGLYKRQLNISQEDLQYVRSERLEQITNLQEKMSKHWRLCAGTLPIGEEMSRMVFQELVKQVIKELS